MTNWVTWFTYQLKASGDGFAWAFEQIDESNLLILPPNPDYLGTWEPARHVWHVTEYENQIVIPSMREWLSIPMDKPNWADDDASWAAVSDKSRTTQLERFWEARNTQLGLLNELGDLDWNAPRKTLWGEQPLSMVVTKTLQHTYEHGDTLLRMGLWWDLILKQQAEEKESNE